MKKDSTWYLRMKVNKTLLLRIMEDLVQKGEEDSSSYWRMKEDSTGTGGRMKTVLGTR
jgi:hypothetical protein